MNARGDTTGGTGRTTERIGGTVRTAQHIGGTARKPGRTYEGVDR